MIRPATPKRAESKTAPRKDSSLPSSRIELLSAGNRRHLEEREEFLFRVRVFQLVLDDYLRSFCNPTRLSRPNTSFIRSAIALSTHYAVSSPPAWQLPLPGNSRAHTRPTPASTSSRPPSARWNSTRCRSAITPNGSTSGATRGWPRWKSSDPLAIPAAVPVHRSAWPPEDRHADHDRRSSAWRRRISICSSASTPTSRNCPNCRRTGGTYLTVDFLARQLTLPADMPEGLPAPAQPHLPPLLREVHELRVLESGEQSYDIVNFGFFNLAVAVADDRVPPSRRLRVGPLAPPPCWNGRAFLTFDYDFYRTPVSRLAAACTSSPIATAGTSRDSGSSSPTISPSTRSATARSPELQTLRMQKLRKLLAEAEERGHHPSL